jgi:predicted chitinase
MFCAQVGHESLGLRYMEEIASGAAYEGRADLGNTQPGDGTRFKGRGPIQLTSRTNYGAFGRWCHAAGLVGSDDYFVVNPQQVAQPRWGFLAAAWYWTVARPKLNVLADAGDIEGATRAVNGGLNGLADRIARWTHARTIGAALLPAATDSDGDDVMTPELQQRLDRLEKGLATVVQQLCGENATIDAPWPAADKVGWQTTRWGVDKQERLSLVDLLRSIDRQLMSRLDLAGRPGTDTDNELGQLLSLRAELRALTKALTTK